MQLELPFWDVGALRHQLESLTGERIDLKLTNNASTMMTFKPGSSRRPGSLRLHHMFLTANPEVVSALAAWMTGSRRRGAARLLDDFIESNQHLVTRRNGTANRYRTRGAVHDLQPHYEELNAEHFDASVDAPITWGRLPTVRRRRSIRLGSYTPEDHLIRIHPYLDQSFVPVYFVRYIIFHEMLHAHLGFETTPSGRRRVHTREFYRRERAFPDYERAIAWHNNPANLSRLLRPARKSA